ncbi:MAG: alkaline phosphatase family protein [Thermodesulfobacteriota bacterium]
MEPSPRSKMFRMLLLASLALVCWLLPSAALADIIPPKVIMIAIDAMDPRYLDLDRNGNPGGCDGNWLMPEVHKYLKTATWFKDTRDYLPSATDMNHLNAFAGGYTGTTGVSQVSAILMDWDLERHEEEDTDANTMPPTLAYCRDDLGRPVDTLFNAYKRKYPYSKTFLVSGKEWVAEMFAYAQKPDLDYVLTAGSDDLFLDYGLLPPARGYQYFDPSTDTNPILDPESRMQQFISAFCFERDPESFPPDEWTVKASLRLINLKRPDFGFILLAQMDDAQHGLGAAWDPASFVTKRIFPHGLVSVDKFNDFAFREGILDAVRDVDANFGKLVDGIRANPLYKNAIIVLYSDHGQITHRNEDNLIDIIEKSQFDTNEQNETSNTDFMMILHRAGYLNDEQMNYWGFCPILATSVGVVYYKADSWKARHDWAVEAKRVLDAHWVLDEYGNKVCPWYILTQDEMENGMDNVCEAGELYNPTFAKNNAAGTMHWPDLYIFMKDKWQLPSLSGMARNIGVELPDLLADWIAPVNMLMGGHGSTDTQRIVMAFSGPGIAQNKVVRDMNTVTFPRNYRISDIAVTLTNWLELGDLYSTTVGRDLSPEIKAPPAITTNTGIISNLLSRFR